MALLTLAHRWAGGVIGLVLAILGLSGTLLLWRDALVWLPHAGDSQRQDAAALVAQAESLAAAGAQSILFASREFGLTQAYLPGGAGLYADQSGAIVTRWASLWERPELWLFDLHHHLLTGDTGETVTAVAGVVGMAFVVTGVILWWRTRRTFRLRLWPRRFSRAAIIMHHRDLGIVMAPLLFFSMATGTLILIKPLANLVLAPQAPGEIEAALKAPKLVAGAMPARVDWQRIVTTAQARFPGAELRVISLPRKPGDPIAVRMRQSAEWLPNGRSTLWFDPADARLLAARDALALPAGVQAFNTLYPLHAAKVGGIFYRIAMTFSGIVLTMLGSFTVWSFWFRAGRSAPLAARADRADRGRNRKIERAAVAP